MTRENAILCLKGIKNYGRDTFTKQSDWQESLDMAIEALKAEPIKHGRWEDLHDGCYACGECNSVADLDTPFCPYCGAKMDLDEVKE